MQAQKFGLDRLVFLFKAQAGFQIGRLEALDLQV